MRTPQLKMLREDMGLSQNEMAQRLGISRKAVQSYEQGWRVMPPYIEKLLILHAILHAGPNLGKAPKCWEVTRCPSHLRRHCPSYRVPHAGFCWFVTGTLCQGKPSGGWTAKRERCLDCPVLKMLLRPRRRSRPTTSRAATRPAPQAVCPRVTGQASDPNKAADPVAALRLPA